MSDKESNESFSQSFKKGSIKGAKLSVKYGTIGAIAGSAIPIIGTMAGGLAGIGIAAVVGIFDDESENEK